jgi:TolB-like protein/Tfp pilus assembly protein PilF/tRNA A-37 threonylcarbamoyl transferase component Bud32
MPDDSAYAPFAIARREDGTVIELGRGAMGITYKATDTQLGRTVALKVINTTYLGDPIARRRFLAEARAAAQLHHSNVAGVYQLRAEGEHIFYAMEFVEGETVDAHVRRCGPLPSRLALRIILQAAQGLAAADARGLIHRDIKPANLMLAQAPAPAGEGIEHEEEDGLLVKVIDFGLAKNISGNETGGGLTGGNVVGTPYFMSPEQISIESGSSVDCRSDIYSLGVTLWYLLTGRPPFEGSQFQILSQHLQKRPPLEKLSEAGVPTEIVALIGTMLTKDREERPVNHPALISVLKKLLRAGGASTAAQPAYESPRAEAQDATMAMPAATAGKAIQSTQPSSGTMRADEGFWVAVLPFKYSGVNAELTALAGGLTEDIVTGLSKFSYLRVIARSSTSRYTHESVDVRVAGKELGARYVMEGSLRQVGSKLRLAVQLVDAVSGAHLWAENYERTFSPEALFELQDDLVPRIVSTIADTNGILPRSMSEVVRSRPPEQLTPYEAVLRSFGYFERVTADDLAAARAGLESAVQKAPAYADAWAMLALLCAQEYGQGFHLQADSLASASTAARRAVELAPSNHLAHYALAQVFFFQKESQRLRNTADRAIALNPMDGNSIAFLGEVLTYSGDSDRGLALAARAKQLNPNHPGWYWYADTYNAFRQGDDRGALNFVLKANLPAHWGSQAMLAAAHGHLREHDAAARAVRELLKIRPDFAATVRSELEKWFDPVYGTRLIDGLRKAGLEIPDERNPSARADATAVAIAVLPFADLSEAKDQAYLCEGMAEEIMNALVQIDGIRVASRTSAFRAKQNHVDLPAIARALAVGHVLEGSVRTSGSRLRVTAQLTDVESGFQLWSERFDREAADIFAVQDEIAAGVMEAVKARFAPGQKSIQPRPRVKNLEAYRSYLRGRHLRGKEHHDGALRAFEEAVRLDPSHAPSWTGLAEVTVLASVFGVIPAREACASARKALATAQVLQGESADGLHVEAFVAWIERRWPAMEAAWNRAIQLQPNHVLALASFGLVLCTRQRPDEGLHFLERARQADPLASFPYSLTGGGLINCRKPQDALRYLEDALAFEPEDATALDNAGIAKVALGRFEEGIAMFEHVVAVSHRGAHFLGTLGWALATAGRKREARTILDELRARPPGAPVIVPEIWLLGALGELDAAFEVVARAEEEWMANLYFTGLPGFDSLRADPRFAALEKRLGLRN